MENEVKKKSRIYIVAETEEEEQLFKSLKKLCIDKNATQKELLLKMIKNELNPTQNI